MAAQKSQVLKEMHDTARDLFEIGMISKRRMRGFDVPCGLKVEPMPPRKIRHLREKARMSQSVFAAVLNTSVSTIQRWEIGEKKPSGPSLKLLSTIERKGVEAVL